MSLFARVVIGVVFAALDAFVGWIWLGNQFPSLSYLDFLGIAVFGTAIIASALTLEKLRD